MKYVSTVLIQFKQDEVWVWLVCDCLWGYLLCGGGWGCCWTIVCCCLGCVTCHYRKLHHLPVSLNMELWQLCHWKSFCFGWWSYLVVILWSLCLWCWWLGMVLDHFVSSDQHRVSYLSADTLVHSTCGHGDRDVFSGLLWCVSVLAWQAI